jgi:acyl-CoA synthetase (AMP-forming)/AMP-acid ligase II
LPSVGDIVMSVPAVVIAHNGCHWLCAGKSFSDSHERMWPVCVSCWVCTWNTMWCHRRPHMDKTFSAFVDGYLRTGDKGYFDDDGCVVTSECKCHVESEPAAYLFA